MRVARDVFNDHVEHVFKHRSWSKKLAHDALYGYERAIFPSFPSALLQATRDNALEACKALKLKFKPKRTSETSSVRYDRRAFSVSTKSGARVLTLATVNGRIKANLNFPKWCEAQTSLTSASHTDIKLIQLTFDKKKKQFFANVVVEITAPEAGAGKKTIGLDRGLINIIATSEGVVYDAKKVRKNQRKHLFLRKRLSAKGTRSAKRLLKAISGRERRFSRDVNHCISKELATDMYMSVAIYVIEDLKGIRRNKKKGKKLNKLLSSWSFYELETFLTYKCEALGIKVVKVDPRYTSQTCNVCGFVHRDNRNKQSFVCLKCGNRDHADVNAAKNIRSKHLAVLARQGTKGSDASRVNCPTVTASGMPRSFDCQGYGLVP